MDADSFRITGLWDHFIVIIKIKKKLEKSETICLLLKVIIYSFLKQLLIKLTNMNIFELNNI